MILDNILSGKAFTKVNKALAKEIGFLTAGFLGELVSQRIHFDKEEFYFSQSQMKKELGITDNEQRTCVKKLVAKGLISVEKKGHPAKYHFRINDIKVMELICSQSFEKLSTSPQESEALVLQNLEHKDKNNNKKESNMETTDVVPSPPTVKKVRKEKKLTSYSPINQRTCEFFKQEVERRGLVYEEFGEMKEADAFHRNESLKTFATQNGFGTISEFITWIMDNADSWHKPRMSSIRYFNSNWSKVANLNLDKLKQKPKAEDTARLEKMKQLLNS